VASGDGSHGSGSDSGYAVTLDTRHAVIPRTEDKTTARSRIPGGSAPAGLSRSKPDLRRRSGERAWEEQSLLWCAFAFAAGVAVYALLPEEPSLVVLGVVLAGAGLSALFLVLRQTALGRPAVLLLALWCGLTAGSLRTAAVAAPRIGEAMNVTVTGQVVERTAGRSGARLVVRVDSVGDLDAAAAGFPGKVRLRVPAESGGQVGEHVRLRARLFPPMGPVFPGGYDYSFRAYFDGIGATGFSYGPATVIKGEPGSAFTRSAAFVAQLRAGLAERIRALLPGAAEAPLIVALLVGDRSGITEEQEQVLRSSGLAHILAISGLHMALFAGGTYAAVLLLLALYPPLTLNWPIHKWAALAALASAAVYLAISGAAVATQRSFVMIAVVFLGILVGRRGITLRSVALAGLLLLLIAPERLFFPGFQMSFSAVICLVAVYDLWRRRRQVLTVRAERPGGWRGLSLHVARWGAGLFVTALVAGLATGIVGAHHFGRVAPFGLVGNMLGMPVFSLLVMPMGVLALVLMPFGLAALPLSVMSCGVAVLMEIARFTAGLEAGAGATGRLDGAAALLLLSALFGGLLVSGRARFLAALPLVAGLTVAAASRPPDLQIGASGQRVAARDASGLLRYSGRPSSFETELWLQAEGVPTDTIKTRKMTSPQRRCDESGCVVRAHGPPADSAARLSNRFLAVALPKLPEAVEDDCRYADIIVSDIVVPGSCGAGLVIDREARSRRGAASLWLSFRHRGTGPPKGTPEEKADTGDDTEGLEIERLIFAIAETPRPWHVPGDVTRAKLRRLERDGADRTR
jgi:competence protein ComEC